MELGRKICRMVSTTRLGDIMEGDICKHDNGGYTRINGDAHLRFARENNYQRVHIHIVSDEPHSYGDYVIDVDDVYGPVEEGDNFISSVNTPKIIISTDKGLDLPKPSDIFLNQLIRNPKTDRVIVEFVKVYNNGEGWKYALLPSEWNDDVKTQEKVFVDEANVSKIYIPDSTFSLEDLYDAFSEFALCGDSDRPNNKKELEEKFNEFLIKRITHE